ncbi:MAG: SMC-Scp complex subunit ScpB [Parvularculaceae bacterium]|nr:SMC-Scp complex subunit ScpB [Parvularculaceae bacterium]
MAPMDEPLDAADGFGGEGRAFETLSAREAQEALAEELEDMTDESGGAPDEEGVSSAPTAKEMAEHLRMIEALLFAAAEPLDEEAIAARLPANAEVPTLLEALAQTYENRGVVLSTAAGRYRFITAPDVAHILQKEKIEPRKLSRAALETLAIIAYHQPCTRADIEDVRGVAVSPGSLDQLMEIGWVRLRGRRKSAPGRPILYGTTDAFLQHFNLESAGDLPGMADLKAAGLLDARLPPGFVVPSPVDDLADEDIVAVEDEVEFVTDYQPEDPGEDR